VGCITAACLAREGHQVVGVDIEREKVVTIQQGKSPIIEPGLATLIQAGVLGKKLEATSDRAYAVDHAEIVMISVGTPSKKNGGLDLVHVERVCQEIGQALRNKLTYTVIVVRSTILPGAASEELIPILEVASGKKVGSEFGFCVNPEFLREGSAIFDFDHPPYTIIGEYDEKSGDLVAQLYAPIDAPLYRVTIDEAGMVKYSSNAFHALKVVFANEIGNLCQAYGVDSHKVMEIFVRDTKLNLSSYYLKPGFAFGGSCLPKDLRALLYAARRADVQLPVVKAILPSNRAQVQKALDMLLREGKRKVGIIGLSFKPSTDDLRESPAVELAERLIGKGFELFIYDREVSLSKLHGSNRVYIDQVFPHISSIMRSSLADIVHHAETIVVAKKPSQEEYHELVRLLRTDQTVIDLVRLNEKEITDLGSSYRGICW